MMDKKNSNGFSSKAPERGSQRKQLPYSVETPYGFHLDLDFLKYVDDIEKGNTIKKVHIQRRNKGPKFSTLPRNFSLPGHASRATPKDSWASTSTLGPKPRSRVTEVQQIFEFRACEGGSLGQPSAPEAIHTSTRGDGSIREFDEQSLGIHVRPHLLRASSMPVTVLQGRRSEPMEDRGAQAAGERENGSSGQVFISSDVVDVKCGTPLNQTALHQQFATALLRIRELEEQVRTIPELKTEICALREEKERLLSKLNSQPLFTAGSVQNAGDDGTDEKVQIPVNPESVVTDTASSLDQEVVPSPVPEPEHKSVTELQESEVQEETKIPLENPSVNQEEVSESALSQEQAEQEPADSSTTHELVTQEDTLQEPVEEEPALSLSTQELVKDGIAESSSVQEPNEQDPAESLITLENTEVGIDEHLSVQEPAEREVTERSTTPVSIIQEKISEVSLHEPKEGESARSSLVEELVMQDVIAERCKTPETAEQELADSPSVLQSVKLEEDAESSSAMEFEERETTEPPTAQVSEREEVAELPTAQETVVQNELSESSSVQEPVVQNELSEDSSVQEPVTLSELSEDSSIQEPVTISEISEDSSVQETVILNELSDYSSIQETVTISELSEDSSIQETVVQNELSESSSEQEPVTLNEISEDSSIQEPVEKEKLESATAEETLKQDISVSSTAEECVEEETAEPPTAQESAQEEGSESQVVREAVEQDEMRDSSSTPEAAGQETTMDTEAQIPTVQGEVLDGYSTPATVLHEQTEQTSKVEEATEVLVIMEGQSGQEQVEIEGDELSRISDNLTIKELQEKLMVLEEKFSDANKELENTNALLMEQIDENKLKEERIKLLIEETKVEKAQVEQRIDDSGDEVLSSGPTLTCDVSVCTDSAPELVSKEVSTDGELLFSGTLPVSAEHQNTLVSMSTQTSFTEALVLAEIVEKPEEVELIEQVEVPESASQEEPCSTIQMEPEKATEADSSAEPVGPESSECAASDGPEEACTSLKVTQPCQSSQEREVSPKGPSEPAASNAAIGQYVNRIQGLLNEQWACLGSGPPPPPPTTTTTTTTIKQPASKFSSIQTQLVSSLSALSAFYSSPGQKGGATRQAALKSIMKKNNSADKPGNGGAKKNLKFVGVNGGYETTSSEDSSEEDNAEDSSEPEEKEVDAAVTEVTTEVTTAEEPACEGACAAEPDFETAALETSSDFLEEQPGRESVDGGFMSACHFIKDRQAEIAAPDKEMRDVLTTLYHEWFHVSSQKDSLVDTVTLYLKEVGAATPTLLRFLINLADGNGNTALHYSVSHSNFSIVKLLLDTGLCEVDIQNKAGYTAIMLASLTTAEGPEDMEVAMQLLKQGNANARASQAGQTALMLAVSHGRVAMVRLLLACGAEVNMQDHDGSTALMCACEHGHAEIARLLLQRPECDLSLTDREGHSALEVAVKASHSELVDLLKAHASDRDPDAPRPL